MQKALITLPAMKIVGIATRTNNEAEIDPLVGNIFPCIRRYFHQALFDKIPNRKNPGVTLCVYTDYASDQDGDYTYVIGEEVTSFSNTDVEDFSEHTIAAQDYAKFTNGPAPMPQVVREPWAKIWQMNVDELGGKRRFLADFEVYDQRAADHQNIILDILIGIEPNK